MAKVYSPPPEVMPVPNLSDFNEAVYMAMSEFAIDACVSVRVCLPKAAAKALAKLKPVEVEVQ